VEVAISKMINASQRMIANHSQVQGQAKDGWGLNSIIKTLQMLQEMQIS
jgi:hypothetical protein